MDLHSWKKIIENKVNHTRISHRDIEGLVRVEPHSSFATPEYARCEPFLHVRRHHFSFFCFAFRTPNVNASWILVVQRDLVYMMLVAWRSRNFSVLSSFLAPLIVVETTPYFEIKQFYKIINKKCSPWMTRNHNRVTHQLNIYLFL